MINPQELLNNVLKPQELLNNVFSSKKEEDIENKKEHELNDNDRMKLINKKLEDSFLIETYSNFLEKRNDLNFKGCSDVNEYVFNDVEFISDHYQNKEKGLFFKINKCKTNIGKLLLEKILTKPIHDINLLKERQDIIKKVIPIKNQLIPIYEKINVLENDLMWFWNEKNMKHIELMNDLIYFNYDFIPFLNVNDILNNNERALLITNIYKIIVAPLITILTPLLSVIIPLVVLIYVQKKSGIQIPIAETLKVYFKSLLSADTMKILIKNPTQAFLASFVTKGIYVFMYFQNIYYSIQSANNSHKIINIIHEKLNKMNEYLALSKQIVDICHKNDIKNLSPFLENIRIVEDIGIYNEYFNHEVFTKDPSLFSNKGKILHTFRMFSKTKQDLPNVFNYTGVIDSILSIENVLSSSTENHPYCFTKFVKDTKPCIDSKNIWHPYLDKTSCNNTVKNDIEMKNNILITGPNAAGKSTFIKSVILNIILSQTIGICSASKFELTPFKMIETYLHIPDSKGSSSLFEAEMFRSKDYIEKIKSMDKNDFSFIVLDEIFSSTNYVEGFSGAYSIIKKISSFENTLSITTTHYTDLEVLEKDTNGKVVNYKFEVDYDKENNILFNYKIKRGISRQYIALDLLKKNNFDEDIIKDAIEMCNKLKNKSLDNQRLENEKPENKKKDNKKKKQ